MACVVQWAVMCVWPCPGRVIHQRPCVLLAALIVTMGFCHSYLNIALVRERTKDTWGLWRKDILDPESNVQFGEGGAGTLSDGKLYCQIKDPRLWAAKC